nr:nitroreductase family protein [Candidatus Sigynarchaeota archaeon]
MFNDILLSRRSVRKFSAEPVPREKIETMIVAANHAPSGGNFRPWRFVVVSNRHLLDEIKAIILKGIDALPRLLDGTSKEKVTVMQNRYRRFSLFFHDAPVTVFVSYDTTCSNLARTFRERGMSQEMAEREAGYVEIQGTAAAIENFMLAAHALGLGTCWMDPPFFARTEISKLLDLPPEFRLLAMAPVGKPAAIPATARRDDIEKIARFIP